MVTKPFYSYFLFSQKLYKMSIRKKKVQFNDLKKIWLNFVTLNLIGWEIFCAGGKKM